MARVSPSEAALSDVSGHVQPHGWVLILDPDRHHIIQASANIATLAGRPAPELLGQPLAAVTGPTVADALWQILDERQGSGLLPPIQSRLDDERTIWVQGHWSPGGLILEIEPEGPVAATPAAAFGCMVRQLRHTSDMAHLARLVVRFAQQISGLERLLLLRLDEQGAQVLASAGPEPDRTPPTLDRLLGGSPALLSITPLHLVADAHEAAVPLLPPVNPLTDGAADMARALLRAPQGPLPAGSRSVLAVSLTVHGRLWGLLWGSSSQPLRLTPPARALCEGLAEVAGAQIAQAEDRAAAARREAATRLLDRLATALRHGSLADTLVQRQEDLTILFGADGVLISVDGSIHRHGQVGPVAAWTSLLDGTCRDGISHGVSSGDPAGAALRIDIAAGNSLLLLRQTPRPWSSLELEAARILHAHLAERHADLIRIQAERELHRLANYDSVTGLPNRGQLLQELQRILASGSDAALLVVVLDRFRQVRGSLGDALADRLLTAIGRRLESGLAAGDLLARIDGGVFAALLPDPDGAERAATLSQAVREAMRAPVSLDGRDIYVTASLGLVAAASPHGLAAEALRNAEIAAAEAEQAGGGARAFNQGMLERLIDRYELYDRLRRAIYFGRSIEPRFQPIVDLRDTRLIGAEALARWTDTDKGVISPKEFIPVAEETGLIVPLGNQILMQSCRQAVRWNKLRPQDPIMVAVNLSPHQLQSGRLDIVRWVAGTLEITGANPSWLRLEITESGLIANSGTAIDALHDLRQLGVGLAIDDFGTGYSSLSYLQRLPIDTIKIDASFVSAMTDSTKALELVRTILHLAQAMGLGAVAEGIETREQLNLLQELGCPYGQGYLFAPALAAEAILPLVSGDRPWLAEGDTDPT